MSGFTLAEFLVVSVIMSTVALGVYSAFTGGLAVWDRMKRGTLEEGIVFFLERLSYDLENILRCSEIKFEGKTQSITFPANVEASLGRITYYFDKDTQSLNREEQDYSQVYQKSEGKKRRLVEGINTLCFYYLSYDKEQRKELWKEIWEEENLPQAVKVEIGLDSSNYKISRVMPIPLSFTYSVKENNER